MQPRFEYRCVSILHGRQLADYVAAEAAAGWRYIELIRGTDRGDGFDKRVGVTVVFERPVGG